LSNFLLASIHSPFLVHSIKQLGSTTSGALGAHAATPAPTTAKVANLKNYLLSMFFICPHNIP